VNGVIEFWEGRVVHDIRFPIWDGCEVSGRGLVAEGVGGWGFGHVVKVVKHGLGDFFWAGFNFVIDSERVDFGGLVEFGDLLEKSAPLGCGFVVCDNTVVRVGGEMGSVSISVLDPYDGFCVGGGDVDAHGSEIVGEGDDVWWGRYWLC
jgi:hypothetical protein